MTLPDIKTDFSLSLRPDRVGRKLASILKESPGPKKPASLQSTDLTRLVSFEAKMLVTTSPLVRCTLLFHFQCCQGLSIFSDKQQPQAETFS